MSDKKQTAVEWLIQQVNSDCLNSTFINKELIEKAKEMEKEQLMFGYNKGATDMSKNEYDGMENYYNKTYGKEETK